MKSGTHEMKFGHTERNSEPREWNSDVLKRNSGVLKRNTGRNIPNIDPRKRNIGAREFLKNRILASIYCGFFQAESIDVWKYRELSDQVLIIEDPLRRRTINRRPGPVFFLSGH